MECAVIITYRCNARCQMCHTWKNPSKKSEEIAPEIIDKIEGRYKRLNITGGEPMLRDDILEIVEVLDKKTDRLEISTNGYFTDRIIRVAERFPNITIRVSLEGLPAKNDELRGIKNGFDHGLRTILRLKEMGVKDIGFATTISGQNCHDLLDLYTLVSAMDIEFANAVVHNSFYFHKDDNEIKNRNDVEESIVRFMDALLKSPRKNMKHRAKDWFRAYLNLGLLRHVQGKLRTIPCGAATDTFFLDPYGQVLACNGSDQPMIMGDFKEQSFDEIWHSQQAEKVREMVQNCKKGCWMTGTAVPAMRRKPWKPIYWVINNKLRLAKKKPLRL
ncbi:MAG: radical SAM protein [Desulfobacteraceae bacterium]|nr:radical SAM protein [Desulfobacteraceae bacterium]MBC2720241.1 radical SAM protein [Desulfobacteraceae bacterium]